MKKNIFALSLTSFSIFNSSILFAAERDESGAIMTAMICALIGCTVPTRPINAPTAPQNPTKEPPTTSAQPRRAESEIGILQIDFTPIGQKFRKQFSPDDLDMLNKIPSHALKNYANKISNSYSYSSASCPQAKWTCKSPYIFTGNFIISRIGTNPSINAFCIEYRNILRADNRPNTPLFSDVEDVHGIVCDNYLIGSGYQEPGITEAYYIQWQ